MLFSIRDVLVKSKKEKTVSAAKEEEFCKEFLVCDYCKKGRN
jgi:hypothetical protein